MKRIVIIVLMIVGLSLVFGCTNPSSETNTPENGVRWTIEEFYELSYKAYLQGDLHELRAFLDMDSKWTRNYLNYMEATTETYRYSNEKGYTDSKTNKNQLDYEIEFTNIDENDDSATVKISITGDNKAAYPFFICLGENEIELKKAHEHWTISNVKCDNSTLFQTLNTGNIDKIDKKQLHKQIDGEYEQ